jgi:hypothetical protein
MQYIRKISGFFHHPNLQDKDHVWFYFFFYSPGSLSPLPLDTKFIKFFVVKDETIELEINVKYSKSWGSMYESRTYDLPAPPAEISGHLLLKDYTFLAENDFRKPDGYHIKGRIMEKEGQWLQFVPLSNILGFEPKSQIWLAVDQGWLELSNGRSHSMKEAVSPLEPYVKGWWDGKGYFHPDPIKIYGFPF